MAEALILICDLRITAGGRTLDFKRLEISSSGTSRLPTSAPKIHLAPGSRVQVEITLPDLPGAHLGVPGRVIRELTKTEENIGLDFDWVDQSLARELLDRWIESWGKPVVPNRRKHPRLASPQHPLFPRSAIVSKASESVFAAEGPEYAPWEAQVANLSVEGVLLSSTHPLAGGIRPGDGLHVILESRDAQAVRIETVGGVRRITEALDPLRNLLVRSFGLRFEWLDSDQREIYQRLIQNLCAD